MFRKKRTQTSDEGNLQLTLAVRLRAIERELHGIHDLLVQLRDKK